ncbi:hypothetical protein ACRRTK_005689 [Alexandromys fortis]
MPSGSGRFPHAVLTTYEEESAEEGLGATISHNCPPTTVRSMQDETQGLRAPAPKVHSSCSCLHPGSAPGKDSAVEPPQPQRDAASSRVNENTQMQRPHKVNENTQMQRPHKVNENTQMQRPHKVNENTEMQRAASSQVNENTQMQRPHRGHGSKDTLHVKTGTGSEDESVLQTAA